VKTLCALLVVGAALAGVTHAALDRAQADAPLPADVREVFPSITTLRLVSLGYESLVADYYWLRALNYYGDRRNHERNYPSLPALLDRVLALDPYFRAAYIFAGSAFAVKPFDPRVAVRHLERGVEYRPDEWRIPFLLGFTAYYSLGDYATAARAMARAASYPEAPDYLGPLATRLAAEAGQPQMGLQLIDALLEEVEDETLRARYEDARRRLLIDLHLAWLREAVHRFEAKEGRRPASIDQLVASGIMRAIPDEPLGGRYYLDDAGNPATTMEAERLRLPAEAKGVDFR
jgi:hypothetical protein